MGDFLLEVQSDKPGSSKLTLVDGATVTGYSLREGANWGNAVWDVLYSGPRGTQGARATGATPQNRPLVLPFRVIGASKDDLFTKLSALSEVAAELRLFGGRVTWRAKNQTYRQYFEVMAGSATVDEWKPRSEHSNVAEVLLSAACAPYLSGDPMDVFDDFSTDTIGDYTFDTGGGTIAVSGGQLVPTTTAFKRFWHSARGYSYLDCQGTLKVITGASVATHAVGVMLRRQSSTTYLTARTSNSNVIRINKVVAGVETQLATAVVNWAANTTYWIRFRAEGPLLIAEVFTSEPTPMVAPFATATVALTAAEQAIFPAGPAGIYANGLPATDWRFDDFSLEPYTYRNVTLPEELQLGGSIPGDAPALAELELTHSGGASAPAFALVGWWERPQLESRVFHGDFDRAATATNGWSVAAVTNISAAATSITNVADTMLGPRAAEIVTPATLDSGASFRIARRFLRGVTYTFEVLVRAPASTTLVYARVGSSSGNDKASSASVALTTAAQKLTVTWTPTADRTEVYVAVNVGAATATTFRIDGAICYRGTVAPSSPNQSEGRGGDPPIGIIEAERASVGLPGSTQATYRGGQGVRIAHGGGLTIYDHYFYVDPDLLAPDDYTQGEIALEVWARYEYTAGTTYTLTASALPVSSTGTLGAERFTAEYGRTGKTLVSPSAGTVIRFIRLGTLLFPTDLGRWWLRLSHSVNGAAGSIVGFDYLLLVPALARALSPTAKPNDVDYPAFLTSTTELAKKIRSDLSATLLEVADGAGIEIATHGLGGSLLELPPGDVDAVVKLCSLVPDDPTSNATTEQLSHSATVHFAITPRYTLARGS